MKMKIFILTLAIASFSLSLKAQDFQIQITNASLYEVYYGGGGLFGKKFHGKINPSSTVLVTADNGIAVSTSISFSWKNNPNEYDTTCFMPKAGEIYVVGDPKENSDPKPSVSYNQSTWVGC